MFPVGPDDVTSQSETVPLVSVFLAAPSPDPRVLLALGRRAPPLPGVRPRLCRPCHTSCPSPLVRRVTGLDGE